MIIDINITPLRSFVGKILPMYNSEMFLFKHFTKCNKSGLIKNYLNHVEKIADTSIINYETMFHMFIIYDKVLTRNIPVNNKLFLNYKVIDLIETDRSIHIKVEYKFD